MDSGAGGAAVHAGVDFQQRLVAYFATAMLSEVDVSPMLAVSEPLLIERISMETADSVDDFSLDCHGERRVLVQAKSSPVLSSNPGSEFAAAVNQFVNQFYDDRGTNNLYVLAVGPNASARITQQLRKLLLAIRYDSNAWKRAPLTNVEKDVLNIFSQLVQSFSQERGGCELTDHELIRFAQRVHVATFDMDDSGSDCRTAYILLRVLTRLKSPADLVWSRLVQLCLDASKRRLQIGKDGLRSSLSRFIEDAHEKYEAQSFFEIAQTGSVEAGKEIVLLSFDETKILIAELHRFDGQGKPRVKFANNKCTLQSGEYVLLHRTSTIVGMERYLVKHSQSYADRQVVLMPAVFDADPNLSNAAKARAAWVREKLDQLRDKLSCLNCGKSVSARIATVIEVDDQDHSPDAGIVHEHCVQPMHRVLGEIVSKFAEDNPHLIDFDIKLWVQKLRTGQGLLTGLRGSQNASGARIVWNPDLVETNRRYCIRILLSDGSRPAILRREKVHQFSLSEAKEKVTEFERHLADGLRIGNPLFMSADGRIFGDRSSLAKMYPEESVSECKSAEVVLFSRQIAEEFDRWENYYAPLITIRVGESEELFKIGNAIVFLSDVFQVEKHFLNWAAAGIILPDYYLEIIEDDAAFDIVMKNNLSTVLLAVIDPFLAPDGTVMNGQLVMPIAAAIEASKQN